jgi:predicted transcriptional regulator
MIHQLTSSDAKVSTTPHHKGRKKAPRLRSVNSNQKDFFCASMRVRIPRADVRCMFCDMEKTVSFGTDSEKVEALGALAAAQERDRASVLNEAVDCYLDLNQYHTELIEQGIRQADAGELIDHAEVEKMALPRS